MCSLNITPRAERAKLRTQVRATMVDESDDEMDHTVLSNTLIESLGEWVDWDTLQVTFHSRPTRTIVLLIHLGIRKSNENLVLGTRRLHFIRSTFGNHLYILYTNNDNSLDGIFKTGRSNP